MFNLRTRTTLGSAAIGGLMMVRPGRYLEDQFV
jgi:hypothetical protein